ncbi:hypothetical protein CLPU_3c00980 [Gottschalkia purinilytica]|uniref:Uncharacterized protein n=1 Tax=Gottschalkia purinilytica TaxID=1503 RepID=A0A0L0WD24_GOTPU|nr:hypothetical protein [Gottschalkia purinilytica]KNF09320.1 hypothetical protein CLPU_3c00980 [Gottschalkia purinilytica]
MTDNFKNVISGEIPISHNPRFGERLDNHSSKYNALSKELEKANIDIQLLLDVVQATKELEWLGYEECYKLGQLDTLEIIANRLKKNKTHKEKSHEASLCK